LVEKVLGGLNSCFGDVESLIAHVDVRAHLDAPAGQVQAGEAHAQ
jgi:hypothetical protein